MATVVSVILSGWFLAGLCVTLLYTLSPVLVQQVCWLVCQHTVEISHTVHS